MQGRVIVAPQLDRLVDGCETRAPGPAFRAGRAHRPGISPSFISAWTSQGINSSSANVRARLLYLLIPCAQSVTQSATSIPKSGSIPKNGSILNNGSVYRPFDRAYRRTGFSEHWVSLISLVAMQLVDYLPIAVMLILAGGFVGSFAGRVTPGLSSQSHPEKLAPYECGILPEVEPVQRFPVKFYLVAMLFVIFDVEIIFLFAWASRFTTSTGTAWRPWASSRSSFWRRSPTCGNAGPSIGTCTDGRVTEMSSLGCGPLDGIRRTAPTNLLTATVDKAARWAQTRSMFPATFGLACCAIEMMATGAPTTTWPGSGWRSFAPHPARPI